MAARPLSLSKSPLSKYSSKKTLGKGGSQLSLPRLTGKGGILVAELSYSLYKARWVSTYDHRTDIFIDKFILGHISVLHYIVTGLMIYNFLKIDKKSYPFNEYIIDVDEFEYDGLDVENWRDHHPKEFVIYIFRKITNSQEPQVIEFIDDFEDNIEYLVKYEYLTYSPEPFTGFFNIYKPLNQESIRLLPHTKDMMKKDDTKEDLTNGSIIYNMTHKIGTEMLRSYDWNGILYIHCRNMSSYIVGFTEVEIVIYLESEYEQSCFVDLLGDYRFLMENLENEILRMIDTKYIRHVKTEEFVARVEVEDFHL